MLWAAFFLIGLVVSGLKARYDLMAGTAAALIVFTIAVPLMFDHLPDLVGVGLALCLVGVASAAIFSESRPHSFWRRSGADVTVPYVFRVLAVLLMIASIAALAVAFAAGGTVGGTIAMGVFATGLAYAFLPDLWSDRPGRARR